MKPKINKEQSEATKWRNQKNYVEMLTKKNEKFKNFLYLLLILFTISCSKISPKGEIESKDVTIENFENLNLKGKFKVFYVQNPKNFVNVETYPNISENLDISAKNNTLNIEENRETKDVDFYNITIYGKNFQKINLENQAELTLSSPLVIKDFSLNLKDNSKFMGSVSAENSVIEMSQKSRANLLGKTKNLTLKISDTASIIAPYWYIENAKIDSKNGNYTEINAENELKGKLVNTSKLVYYGNPYRKFEIKDKASVENRKLP